MEHQDPSVSELQAQLESARRRIQTLESRLEGQSTSAGEIGSETLFRDAVLAHAAEGICVCHSVPTYPYTEFTVWNPRMTELTGYSRDEINRLGWYQTVYTDPETRRHAQGRMDRMREGEDLRSERWEITRSDGQTRTLAISTTVVVTVEGLPHVLALMHDVTAEKELARATELARTDELTGVRNLRAFLEDSTALFKLAGRHGLPITIGYLDLDDFKVVNDTLGHEKGNYLLHALGAALVAAVRSTDVVGRLGGDEFCIVIVGVGEAGARVFFDRLHERLLNEIRRANCPSTISMGVASFQKAPLTVEEALNRSDGLLYQAKKAGKNRVIYESTTVSGGVDPQNLDRLV
jgi:diguanylate cyclase (GGDEF)-like protein/PAS domain S-box-containing protein